jgi:hypothetical protein
VSALPREGDVTSARPHRVRSVKAPSLRGRSRRVARGGALAGALLSAGALVSIGPAPADEPAEEPAAGSEAEKPRARGRFLPIPMFVTEPALGFGLGGSLAYFHGEPEQSVEPAWTYSSVAERRERGKPPPDISGIAAAWTDNGSWGVGVGHRGSWREDTVRYTGIAGYVDLNLDYYLFDIPFGFDIEGLAVTQSLLFRLGSSDVFLGGKLAMLDTDSRFDPNRGDLPEDVGRLASLDAGLALATMYDGRDNTLTPGRGQLVELDLWRYDDAWGGDFRYWRGRLKLLSFHELGSRFVLGYRVEAEAVDGKPPFYAFPWVSLRGIPALRYQSRRAGAVEVEGRVLLHPRWSVVGFAGAGATDGDRDALDTEDQIVAGGVGVRYLYLKDLGLWVGVDVATGPEGGTSYIQVGHAW